MPTERIQHYKKRLSTELELHETKEEWKVDCKSLDETGIENGWQNNAIGKEKMF